MPLDLRIPTHRADDFDLSPSAVERAGQRLAELDRALSATGRDPATLTKSAMVGTLIGATAAEVERRGKALTGAFGIDPAGAAAWLEGRRARWIVGTPDEARATIRGYAEAGVERLMLQDFLPLDLEMVELMGRELVGRV